MVTGPDAQSFGQEFDTSTGPSSAARPDIWPSTRAWRAAQQQRPSLTQHAIEQTSDELMASEAEAETGTARSATTSDAALSAVIQSRRFMCDL